jgi:hypothetical protein
LFGALTRVARHASFVVAGLAAIPAGGALRDADAQVAERAPQADDHRFDRVRSASPEMLKLLHEGYRRSMTFQHLVDRIERSAVIVYIEVGVCPDRRRGCLLHWVGGSGPGRYLRVLVETDQQTDRLLAVVGHEMQHVAEAIDADVRTSLDLIWANRRNGDWSRAIETAAGQAIEAVVLSELKKTAKKY